MIGFYSTVSDLSIGSHRIWVNDLNEYFKEVGVDSKICSTPEELTEASVIIVGKQSAHHVVPNLRRTFPRKIIGAINIPATRDLLDIDFAVVGSVEEKVSLSSYKNVFLFPLIEKMFQNAEQKKHTLATPYRIGFHGHYPHLAKFESGLTRALERLDKQHKIELVVVTTMGGFVWAHGRPKIENILIKEWDYKTIGETILTCDIGVVPNITQVGFDLENHGVSKDTGLYDTDFILRMKSKSNAGRAFVFHQHGIPVIGDLTPSNLHIMGDPACGAIAMNEQSWYRGLVRFMDPAERTRCSLAAKESFDKLYNPHDWAMRLYTKIQKLER